MSDKGEDGREEDEKSTKEFKKDCTSCGRYFSNAVAYRSHSKRCPSGKQGQGPKTNRMLPHQSTRPTFMHPHAQIPLACPHCRATVQDGFMLDDHLRVEHPYDRSAVFGCSVCSMLYRSAGALAQHWLNDNCTGDQESPTGPTLADVLGLAPRESQEDIVASEVKLEPDCDEIVHSVEVNEEEEPIQDEPGPSSFEYVPYTRRMDEPVACPVCEIAYPDFDSLSAHLHIDHQNTPHISCSLFACRGCGLSFRSAEAMRTHCNNMEYFGKVRCANMQTVMKPEVAKRIRNRMETLRQLRPCAYPKSIGEPAPKSRRIEEEPLFSGVHNGVEIKDEPIDEEDTKFRPPAVATAKTRTRADAKRRKPH